MGMRVFWSQVNLGLSLILLHPKLFLLNGLTAKISSL